MERPDEDYRVLVTMLTTMNWDTPAERTLILANSASCIEYVGKQSLRILEDGIRVGAGQPDETSDLLDSVLDELGLAEVMTASRPVGGFIDDLIKSRIKDAVIAYLKSKINDPALLDRAAEWWALRLKAAA